jgi:glycosyltransferase involved in cell wall biosynthesis
MRPNVTVIIPAHNEAQAVGKVVSEVQSVLQKTKTSFEILVVDDASTDQTALKAQKAGAKVVKRLLRGGSGAARKTGLREALGKIVVMLDADGSYDPKTIPQMLKLFPQFDQVNGARDSEQGAYPGLRQPAKWFIKTLASYLTNTSIPDLNTGLKAFKRQPMLKFLWVIPNGFSCVSTMTLAFLSNGYNVTWIPTKYRKRIGISKFHPFHDTLAYLTTVVRIVMYFNPLRIFGPLALVIFVLGLLSAIRNFSLYHTIQQSDIIIFMTATVTLTLGLLADLIVALSKKE